MVKRQHKYKSPKYKVHNIILLNVFNLTKKKNTGAYENRCNS